MRVLAIGGNGFIGYHLVQALMDAGHDVTVIGRRAEPIRPTPEGARYYSGSISDLEFLNSHLMGHDAVAHLASATVPSTGDRNPAVDVEQNVLGTLGLLDAMAHHGVVRLLFLSSGGTIYGIPEEIPVHERHRFAPISSYGIVKATIEMYLELYSRRHGLRPISIRASNPYGPLQGNVGVQGIIGTFLSRVQDGQPIEIWGDGSVVRDFIYVRDLARLCVTALESDKVGAYHAASGIGTSVTHIVQIVQAVTHSMVPVLYKEAAPYDVPVSILDIAKSRHDFNWVPQTDLYEGITSTWRWMRTHRDAVL